RRPLGLRYHAIAGAAPLADKPPYDPDRARALADAHAGRFLASCRDRAATLAPNLDHPPVFVAAFDAELFGHWWHEGPAFLERLLRRAARDRDVGAVTLGQAEADCAPLAVVEPAASTWGAGGDARTWVNPET